MASGLKEDRKNRVIYLYGVTQAPASPKPGISGVDGRAPIETIESAGLVCWISWVPGEEFADRLSENTENLDWLAAMTTAHQRVVAAIAESHDILPARFATVFLNESSLRADVRSRRPEWQADFRRIQDSEEWGIKVFALPPKETEVPSKARSGKDYLKAKSAMLRRRVVKAADDEIASFARELEKISVATAPGGRISGGRRDLQYQASVLLRRSNRKKLESLLRKFSQQWSDRLQIECTGPWPPYSFVSRSAE